MISFIICTHGQLSTGILDAAQMIFGKVENCYALELTPDTSFQKYIEEIQKIKKKINSSDAPVFLVDMYGATPFNSVLSTMSDKPDDKVIYGINLPLFLELLSLRQQSETDEMFLSAIPSRVIECQTTIGFSSVNQLLDV